MTKGSYALLIAPPDTNFEKIENIKDILYINEASGTSTAKKTYFELEKSYNLVWDLEGFTGVQNIIIASG